MVTYKENQGPSIFIPFSFCFFSFLFLFTTFISQEESNYDLPVYCKLRHFRINIIL